jgi:hypothetical protein
LNSATDWQAAYDAGWAAADTDAGYGSLTSKVNLSEPSPLDLDLGDLSGANYDYIFFGVNGGMDETVTGKTSAAGIIVTGNGMDKITGGNLGDLIFAGNGKDVVNAGGGNDIVFGENGADQLNAGSDNGTAKYVAPTEGETVLVPIPGAIDWDEDPNGDSVAVAIPNKTTVSKEGFFIALDDDGNPTELDANDHPVVHAVYSITPETTGWYTVAYTHGNALDGAGDPEPDQFQVFLTAGNKYYYSFVNGDGDTVRADVFSGQITVTSPINDGPDGNPGSVATSEALPVPSWETFFTVEGGPGDPGVFQFTAGDELIGGNGPDTFIYDFAQGPNNVDLIWDYDQGDGTYNALEGDTLVLKNTGIDDVADLVTTSDHDLDGDGNNDLVIFFSENHAIGLVGITDIDQVHIVFG